MLVCLDFDGVIADGADECMIVSWLAWHKEAIPNDPKSLLDRIPEEFRRNFRILRNYVRYDGHFIAPYFITDIKKIGGQKDFETTFLGIDNDLVKKFTDRFQRTRKELRENYPDVWFGLHSLYPGIDTVFESEHNLYIVSGKDSESINAICKKNNIPIDKNKVYGGLKSKTEVLNSLLAQSKDGNSKMIFCDDNLPNVMESKALGITTIWASWGYNTEEHLKIAENEAIDPTSINHFLSIIENQSDLNSRH